MKLTIRFLFLVLMGHSLTLQGSDGQALEALERTLQEDLDMIEYPPNPWWSSTPDAYDVVIVGGGMAGLTAGFALFRQGIFNICIFDENKEGLEGPWTTTARMEVLRSDKNFMGPALFIPGLTLHAWYRAQFGEQAWESLERVSTTLWAHYLQWYRKVLNLPVENECRLTRIIPHNNLLRLSIEKKDSEPFEIVTHKVVLATGRGGFGGLEVPRLVNDLPSSRYTHTGQNISADSVRDKDIVIVGVGASAFDAAAYALEQGARSVALLMRRSKPPSTSKNWYLSNQGGYYGFYNLSNELRWELFKIILTFGSAVPQSSIDRLKKHKNVKLYPNIIIKTMLEKNYRVEIATNAQTFVCDHIILATGYAVHGAKQPELHGLLDKIMLWSDVVGPHNTSIEQKMDRFPFLGPHFEFREKAPSSAPYLKNIHCFNYGAALSHGLLSSDIPAISIGAQRLAEGIARDLFASEPHHLENINEFNLSELNEKCFDWLMS